MIGLDHLSPLDMGRLALAAPFLLGALAALLAGAIGVLRFPDVYTRLHAMNAAFVLGAPLLLVALAIGAPDVQVLLKLFLLALLLALLLAPLVQLVASSSYAAGVEPKPGPYNAPRPGRRPRGDGQ